MRWQQGRRSTRVSDRRGVKAGGIGIIGIIVVLAGWYFGIDPNTLMSVVDTGQQVVGKQSAGKTPRKDDETAQFISVVFASTQDAWKQIFHQMNIPYNPADLVIFDGNVKSACGITSMAVGPFYCPRDRTVYLAPAFIHELNKLGARGDFAFAYVIAHEMGHHAQNLLGTLDKTHRAMAQSDRKTANAISVATELQADCYAGIWAHHLESVSNIRLEPGDLNEGLSAAASVGDDHIMQQAGRSVHPEQFTHGSAKQRQYWLERGIESGNPAECNTFSRS